MVIPKELYIDSFTFTPINNEDKVEKYICDHYNSVNGLVIDKNRDSINFQTLKSDSLSDYYNRMDKRFGTGFIFWCTLSTEYGLTTSTINDICLKILKKNLTLEINYVR